MLGSGGTGVVSHLASPVPEVTDVVPAGIEDPTGQAVALATKQLGAVVDKEATSVGTLVLSPLSRVDREVLALAVAPEHDVSRGASVVLPVVERASRPTCAGLRSDRSREPESEHECSQQGCESLLHGVAFLCWVSSVQDRPQMDLP